MKQSLLAVAVLFAFGLQAQLYTPNSGTAVSSNGNLGINNSSPSYTLDVRGATMRLESASFAGRQLTFNAGGSQSISATNDFAINGARNTTLNISTASWAQGSGALFLRNGFNGTHLMTVHDDGRVGILNSNPAYQLDVTGEANITERLIVGGIGVYTGRINAFQESGFGITSMTGYVAGWFHGNYIGVQGTSNAYIIGPVTGGEKIGVWGSGHNGDRAVGVHGDAFGASGKESFAIWGHAYSGNTTYGVYGDHSFSSGIAYAGYFDGDVYTTGTYLPSDRKLKQNIENLTDGMSIISSLRPTTYEYRVGEFKGMNLKEGQCMGFIAEELKEVLPGSVKETVLPEAKDKDGEIIQDRLTYEAVDYVSLIPVLVAALQEQNEMIKELQAAVAAQSGDRASQKDADNSAANGDYTAGDITLFPNPVSDVLNIALGDAGNAQVEYEIFDLNGRLTKAGSINPGDSMINVEELANGNYLIRLSSNNELLHAQQFAVAK